MADLSTPIGAHFLTGSILSLVLPLGVALVVGAWYAFRWRRGAGER